MFGRGKTTFVSLILVRHFGLKFFTQQTLMDDQLLQALGGVGVRGRGGMEVDRRCQERLLAYSFLLSDCGDPLQGPQVLYRFLLFAALRLFPL